MVSDANNQSHGCAGNHTLSVPTDLVQLGHVSGAYGIKGWLRIQPYSDHADTLFQCKKWWLQSPAAQSGAGDLSSLSQTQCHHIQQVKAHGAQLVAQFASIHDRTQAEQLKGSSVWVSRQDFSPADHNEYYWVDLLGCQVYGRDEAGQPWLIGEVSHMMDNGAHGIMRVSQLQQLPKGQLQPLTDRKGRPKEILIPFVDAHLLSVDLSAKQIFTNWPLELA